VEVKTCNGADAADERRPRLKAELAAAKKLGVAVVDAKLDHLSYDVHFVSGLMAHKSASSWPTLARMPAT
jgi:hypothetical protein